jgi:predicted RND superfamily exporter protein
MRISDRIAHFVVHRRGTLWIALLALAVVSAGLIFWRAKLNSDVLDMLPESFESVNIYKLNDREFSASRELMFGLIAPDDEVDVDGFAEHFANLLRQEPWVVRVMVNSPFPKPGDFSDPRALAEFRAVTLPLIFNQDEKDFAQLRASLQPDAIRARLDELHAKFKASSFGMAEVQLRMDPLGVVFPALKSLGMKAPEEDPRFGVIFVHCKQDDLNEPACNEIMRKVEDFKVRALAAWPVAKRGAAPKVVCTGRTAYVAEMAGKLKSDIISTLLGSIALVGLTFYAGFRQWKPLRAIVDSLLLSCALAVACGAALFGSLNMITIGLCSILVGLGVDLAMVLYALYLHERDHGNGHEQAIAAALRTHGRGIWFGVMTTAAAFLCLLGSGSPGYRQLGVLIACGIMIAGVVMMTFLWLFLTIKLPHWLYRGIVWVASAAALVGAYFVVRTIGSWNAYVWQNVAAGLGAAVLAVVLVIVLQIWTARLPALIFGHPWRILTPSLLVLLALSAFALLPVGKLDFDIDPRSLEPRPSDAGDAMREIMARLNPNGLDSVMAVIQTSDAESFAAAWQKADAAWRKLTPEGAPPGATPLFTSTKIPAALATSPSRIKANAASLANLDLAKTKAAFDEALDANDFPLQEFAGARGLLDALSDAAAGRVNVIAWQQNLPETSAWWFFIDGLLSRDRPLGRAMLTPVHPLETPQDVEMVRKAMALPGVNVGLSGWGFTLSELKPWSEKKMVQLTLLMIALNIIILTVMLRAWKPVAIIMTGLAFSSAGLFVTLKATGITLNLFNILAFPLVLGVGVDYSIYATLAVLSEDPHRELKALMKPLLLSGLTTVIGFITLAWSYNPALRGLGFVCGIGVGWCMITTFIFVLPTSALLVRKKQSVIPLAEPAGAK